MKAFLLNCFLQYERKERLPQESEIKHNERNIICLENPQNPQRIPLMAFGYWVTLYKRLGCVNLIDIQLNH